jgi:hypothetical protein
VRLLERIGAAFGACQNAYTSADETVYTLEVPLVGRTKAPEPTPQSAQA